jgi:uncharacterized repeat protein (TIGR01451 family)
VLGGELRSALFEPLEERLMLDIGGASLPPAIVVGRTLSAYDVPDVQNNQETITLTVFNQAAAPLTGVLLTDTLESGVTFSSASQSPAQSGQQLTWSLGTIQPYDRASVTLTVSLASPIPTQLDAGASAYGTLDAGTVSWTTAPATLRAAAVAANLLASTPDANATDPYVQEKAAELNYDPAQIYRFLQAQIGYNSYSGSVRGARGTLWSSAGNSLDDASLGVALMRASGIPAQYEEGTLSQGQAQQLILSMFPAAYQTVGYVPAGTQTSDPASDPQLLSQTEDHFWFQFDAGGGMTDADPEFANLAVGQAATASTNRFTEVPDSLREKTEISLTAEIYSQADAAFAKGSGLPVTDSVVLDQTFNDVDLVGHPLTLGNFFNTSTSGTAFTATTNTYTPFLDVGDDAYPDQSHDQLIVGTNYQELFTNFPLGNQVLTGLFLNVTLSGPQGTPETFDRTLADRIGYAARQNGGSVNVNVSPTSAPLVGPLDIWSIGVQASLQAPTAALSLENAAPAAFGNVAQQGNGGNLLSSERSAFVTQTRADVAALMASVDALTARLSSQSLIAAYFARPRVDVVSSSISSGPSDGAVVTFETDLRNESIEALPAPGQALSAAESLLYVRGTLESALEAQLVPGAPPTDGVAVAGGISAASVVQAAMAQNIRLISIAPGKVAAVDGLSISADAKARIAAAVGAGFAVIVPVSDVVVSGTSTIAWFQVDPATGETIGVTADGANGGLVEAAFLTAYIANKVGNVEDGFEDKLEQVGEYYADFAFQPRVLFLAFLGLIETEVPDNVIGNNPDIRKAQAVFLVEHTANMIEGMGLAIPDITAKDAFEAEIEQLLGDFETELKANWDDPPVAGALANLGDAELVTNAATSTGKAGSIPKGFVSGAVTTGFLSAAGQLTVSWADTTSTFDSASFTSTNATVLSAGGTAIGSGAVTLAPTGATSILVSGSVNYSLTGSGSLSLYGPAATQLAVSGDWSAYAATTTGTVTLKLTTAGLVLNGQTLPAGTYTVTASAVTLSGSGLSASPDFAGTASVTVNGGIVNLGGGGGSLAIGGTSLDAAYETTFDGYSGTLSLTADGNGADGVQIDGSAENAVTLSPPTAVSADQNTPATFAANVRATAAGSYDYLVRAPAGWTTTVDQAGNVTVTPAPGTQQGTYPVVVIAQSTADQNLISQATVEVTVMPTTPGMTFDVSRDAQFTVPFDGAQLPTAFRATLENTGPAADTYDLTFSNLPSGFALLGSGTSLTVPAGQTGLLGIYLLPTGGPLPPAGTNLSFTVTATSTTDPAITQTVNVSFTMPAIEAATVTTTPAQVATTPGMATTATVTITNVGNVAYNPALAVTTDTGLTISGLTLPGMIPVGQSVTETATLTPDASTPLNSILNAIVNVAPAPTQNVVSVLSVSAQGFVIAGQNVEVSADVFAAVGQAEQGEVSFTITNGQGTTVFSSTSVPVTLSTVGSVAALDLGSVSTSGFAAGEYTVNVTVADSSGQPIPGAKGTGNLFVGLPVSASLSVDSDNATAGPVTSGETLSVTSNALLGNVSTDSTGESVAVNGSLAYVAGSQDISVVDISDPSAPQVLSMFATADVNQGGLNLVQVAGGDLLVASQDPANNGGFKLLIYSLANPNSPALLSTTTVPYAMLKGMTVQGTTAYFSTSGLRYDASGTVTAQVGDLVAVDFSNPVAPAISGALFHDLPQPNGHAASIGQAVAINGQIAYVASSTSTGGDTQTGVGQILVVNTSPPRSVGATLDIPGTVQALAVAVDGTRALVVGSTGGWTSPFGNTSNLGLSGNVTLTLLDISNPANPTIIGSTIVTQNTFAAIGAAPTGTVQAIDLGNGRFAVSNTLSGGRPTILCVDASTPSNLATSNLSVALAANGLATVGGQLLTASAGGLSVYQTAALAATELTVSVTLPSGVSIVPNSLSLEPTISTGANAETLTWSLKLAPGATQQIVWESAIADLQANQVQPVATGATLQFAAGGSNGTLSLPDLNVAGIATPVTVAIPVQVAVPGAAGIANASTAATALGMTNLAARLGDLSTALTNLVQTPDSVPYKSQALAALASILSLMANDPNLEGFVSPLTAARDQLAAADTAADVQAAVVNLGGVLANFGELVAELEQSNVQVTLIPSSVVAQPGVAQDFDVRLQNLGTQTTTYDLSVSGLPASVANQFDKTTITIDPGQRADATLTLTQSGASGLTAASFQVSASAEGVSIPLVRSAGGALTARQQFISVSNVSVTPPFANPGTQIAISAQLLNAVNQSQTGSISYTVTDPNGNPVFTSTATPVTLTVQTSLVTVNLPTLDTTGFALGQYTVHVSVVDANNNAISGATATATLLIGSPVSTTSSVSPQTLSTGDSTVTNTLTVDSQAPLGNNFSLVGQLPITSTASHNTLNGDTISGVALDGKYAYVFGNQGVHIVDISDPTNPQSLTTQSDFPQTSGAVVGNQLIAIDAGQQSNIAVDENSGLTDYSLSGLGTPQHPFRNQTVFPNYTFANSLVVSPDGTHAFVSYEQETYDTSTDTISTQNGTIISVNISSPSNLTFNSPNSVLFDTNGQNDTAPLFQNGGNNNLFGMAQPNVNTLLVGASSSTGTATQTGVGEILAVDVSNPDNINSDAPNTSKVLDTLQIPGTVQVHGIALDGNLALVVASQGGWLSPFTTVDDIGPTGDLVLATIDISNPDGPQLIHEQTLNRAARGGGDDLIALGNYLFAFSSLGETTDTPEIIIVDASDPNDLQVVDQIQVPGQVRGLATDGQYLYASGDAGLLVYSIAGVGSIPVKAQVEVPNGTGVAVVPGSFNVQPTQIITGTQFDTLEWDFTLDPGNPNQTLTWQTKVSAMQPGESRAVTAGTTVAFTVQSTPGQVTLPEQDVVAKQILELDPTQQTTQPGQTAQYTVTVLNPTTSDVTYNLAVQGLPQGWAQIAGSVTVPAGGQQTVLLSITSDPFAALVSNAFVVTATAGGTSGSVMGTLVLAGQAVLPPSKPDARGVVATITPVQTTAGQSNPAVYTVTLTNTGSVTDVYSLAGLFPTGFTGTFSQASVTVPPGVSNFRNVQLTLTPSAGAAARSYPFTVTVTSTSDATVQSQANGTISVVAQGVQVSLTPGSGPAARSS